jgi:hypothetical protein
MDLSRLTVLLTAVSSSGCEHTTFQHTIRLTEGSPAESFVCEPDLERPLLRVELGDCEAGAIHRDRVADMTVAQDGSGVADDERRAALITLDGLDGGKVLDLCRLGSMFSRWSPQIYAKGTNEASEHDGGMTNALQPAKESTVIISARASWPLAFRPTCSERFYAHFAAMSWVQGSGPSAKTGTSKQKATKATAPAGNALQRKANDVRARIEAAYTIPDTVQKRSLLQSYMGVSSASETQDL